MRKTIKLKRKKEIENEQDTERVKIKRTKLHKSQSRKSPKRIISTIKLQRKKRKRRP